MPVAAPAVSGRSRQSAPWPHSPACAAPRVGTASTRRCGFSIPKPATMPPTIIRRPAIRTPRWKAEVEASAAAAADPRRLGGGELAGRRHRERLFLGVGDRRAAAARAERRAGRGWRRAVEPKLGRDHGAEDGDRQQAGDPGDAVVDAGGDPDVAFLDRVEHGRGQRRHRRREAEAEDEDRRQHVGRRSRRRRRPAAAGAGRCRRRSGRRVIGSRGPVPEASLPKRGERKKRMSEIGVVASPASSGE